MKKSSRDRRVARRKEKSKPRLIYTDLYFQEPSKKRNPKFDWYDGVTKIKSKEVHLFNVEAIKNQLAQIKFNEINNQSFDGKKVDKFHYDEFGQMENLNLTQRDREEIKATRNPAYQYLNFEVMANNIEEIPPVYINGYKDRG